MNLIGFLRPSSNRSSSTTTLSDVSNRLCEDPCAEHLLRTGCYSRILHAADEWATDALKAAASELQQKMALVPAGDVTISPVSSSFSTSFETGTTVHSEACYVDRCAVTNAEFERFVDDGAYGQESLWPVDILPYVLQFVDSTGKQGPRFWKNGQPPADCSEHPVVGVCWYEANAFARWSGKRLPNSAEWQRSGSWWDQNVKYPWGNGFDPTLANIWCAGHGQTVPVHCYQAGATPNGICQLVGNTWEWVFASIETAETDAGSVFLESPMGEIRGGAYDTYLPKQATCRFRSAMPLLSRDSNIGFRCCVTAGAIECPTECQIDEEPAL